LAKFNGGHASGCPLEANMLSTQTTQESPQKGTAKKEEGYTNPDRRVNFVPPSFALLTEEFCHKIKKI
jgi:hypothetical protein